MCAYVCTRGCKRQSGFHFPTACYRWQHERRHAKGKEASAAERKAGELKVASAWGKVDEGSGFHAAYVRVIFITKFFVLCVHCLFDCFVSVPSVASAQTVV